MVSYISKKVSFQGEPYSFKTFLTMTHFISNFKTAKNLEADEETEHYLGAQTHAERAGKKTAARSRSFGICD